MKRCERKARPVAVLDATDLAIIEQRRATAHRVRAENAKRMKRAGLYGSRMLGTPVAKLPRAA